LRRRFNPYTLPPRLRTAREIARQLIIPFCIFQAIRTVFLPTTFDVILLLLFLLIAIAFHFEFF
jgi:hypothetical protein